MAFDTITPIRMGQGEIPLAAGVMYTVPYLQLDILKSIDIANTNAAPSRASIYLVPSGGVPSSANVIIPNVLIPGYGIFQWSGTQVMDAGWTIQAISSVSGVSFNASGGGAI